MALIELREVTKSYTRGDHTVTPLEDVTLDVDAGELFVLLGPSGSGKSTLLNLLAGIDRPDAGTIRIGGCDITELGAGELARWRAENVGYVFQKYHLVPVLTAYENVELPLHLFRLSRRQRHERVCLALDAVGLADRLDHYPAQLSGGQEQRVAIARAIVADPPLLLADEPTGDLDAASAAATLRLLVRLVGERNKTLVMVTHDQRAAACGHRVLALDKGRLGPQTVHEELPA